MHYKYKVILPLIILLIMFSNIGFCQLCPTESENEADYCPWPMFHHDIRHTGKTSNFGTQVGKLKWRFVTGGPVTSSPAIRCEIDNSCYDDCKADLKSGKGDEECITNCQDCTIYIGSADNNFYAIDAETGALEWKYTTGGAIELTSPAIDENGVVYIGSNDSYLYAFDTKTIDPFEPQTKWKFKTNGAISSSPSINDDGNIVFTSNDGYIYAINPDGILEWKTYVSASWCSPAIDVENNQIYIGSWKPQASTVTFVETEIDNQTIQIPASVNFFALSSSTGSFKWDFPGNPFEFCVPGGVLSSPVIGPDGSVFASYFITFSNPSPCDAKLWKYNIFNLTSSGGLTWALNLQSDADIYATPAVLEDNSIFVSADNQLFRILPDMTDYFSLIADGSNRIESSPAVDGRKLIYFGSNGGRFYCISADAPQTPLLWQYPSADKDPLQNSDGTVSSIISSPAIGSDDRKSIYVGSSDGNIYAFYDGPRIYGKVLLSNNETDKKTPFSGVKLILTSEFTDEIRETYTDTNGNYEFTGVENFTYTVTPEKIQYYFSPNSIQASISNDLDAPNIDFKAFFGFSISGYVKNPDGTGLANVVMSISNNSDFQKTAITDSEGAFEFQGLNVDTYTITPSLEGYIFNPSFQTANITTSNIELDNEFIASSSTDPGGGPDIPGQLSISGHIIFDTTDNATVTDVTVDRFVYNGGFSGSAGELISSVNPGEDGQFVFSGIESGNSYIIKPRLLDYGFNPIYRLVNVLSSSVSGLTFNAKKGLYISGRAANLLGNGIKDVTVALDSSDSITTTTNEDGIYSFTSLESGKTYTVSILSEGYSSRPESETINLVESREDIDFVLTPNCPNVYLNIPFWGNKGSIVNIFGTNFGLSEPSKDLQVVLDDGTSLPAGVYFGTDDPKTWVQADVKFWSPIKILAEAPGGFGFVNVWVINESSCRYTPAPTNIFILY